MINYQLLDQAIRKSGKKVYIIANACGLTAQGLYNKLEGKREFKHSEICKLCEVLSLKPKDREKIFFAHVVEK